MSDYTKGMIVGWLIFLFQDLLLGWYRPGTPDLTEIILAHLRLSGG